MKTLEIAAVIWFVHYFTTPTAPYNGAGPLGRNLIFTSSPEMHLRTQWSSVKPPSVVTSLPSKRILTADNLADLRCGCWKKKKVLLKLHGI